MTKVILMKNKSVPEDPYDRLFRENGFEPVFLPLLTHTAVNQAEITEFLGSAEFLNEYKALIITSQRAVETLDVILQGLRDTKPGCVDFILAKPSYTVGPATFAVLQRLGFNDIRGGNDAGNGSILADIIIRDHSDTSAKLLFLTGKRHKDILPNKVKEAGFHLKELISYETQQREDIVSRYQALLDQDWIVFFSPQGTQYIVDDILKNHRLKVATIGQTTEAFLKRKGLVPKAVAAKPNPTALLECITRSIT